MTETPPEVTVSPVRKAFFSGASIVWLIPILALAVALGVAWKTYSARGPLIVVAFENGAGIAAGETELKYRDVTVGVVEKVGFTESLARVTATIRLNKAVAPYVDSSAVFWIVQPEVTLRGVTGLSTVLSGVHIEGSWDDTIGEPAYQFNGAAHEPLIKPGKTGLQIALKSSATGELTDGGPILFKGIEVGRVGNAQIVPNGAYAIAEALIFEDYRGLVNQSTRFWDASGFTVSFGPSGAEIDFSSIATLIGGGITFDTFVSGGGRVQDGTTFQVFADKEKARSSVFNQSEVDPLELSVVFDENVSGLAVGAPVEMSGLTIGQVEALSGIVDYNQFGDSRVRLNATISIQPAHLGLPGEADKTSALEFLEGRVVNGMRARLASASLLTGGLKVELVMVEDAPPARLTQSGDALPVLPSTESEISGTAATVEGVFTRINNLPIEELLNSAITFLNSAETLVASDDIRKTPQDVRTLLADLSGLVNSEDVQNVPVALNATLSRVERLVAELEEQRLAQRLVAAVDSASEAAQAVSASVEGVPELITDLRAVATKAEALDVEHLVAEVSTLVASANALIASDATASIPAAVKEAIDQVNATLTELREGGAVRNINQTLATVNTASASLAGDLPALTTRLTAAIDAAETAADTVGASVDGVPELVTELQAVAAKANALNVEQLVAEASGLVASANKLLATDAAQALPASLKDAIDQVTTTLNELRDGGAIRNINQTLASTSVAAANIAETTREFPQITTRLNEVLDTANEAAKGVNSSVAGVPALIDQIRDLTARAQELPLDKLIEELTTLTRSADTLIASEDTRALPAALKGALDEVNATLMELREGGAVANVNRTLESARAAADSVAVSAKDLPRIIERLNQLFAQASRTIEGYDQGKDLGRSAQETLRGIQKAADALTKLARTIERNPNSLLLGR